MLRSLSTGAAVFVVAVTVTIGPTTAASPALVAATCGAPIAGVIAWACSRSGAKRRQGVRAAVDGLSVTPAGE